MFASGACQPGFYVVAMPFPNGLGPSMMPGGAMPSAMAPSNPVTLPSYAEQKERAIQIDITDVASICGRAGGAKPSTMAPRNPVTLPACAEQEERAIQIDITDAASICGRVWQLSQDPAHCRDVQRMLEDCDETGKIAIAAELRGHVIDAVYHPFANFVIQKCIETLRPEASQFIIDELMYSGRVVSIAHHKYGCRTLLRLLEFCRGDQLYELVQKVICEALGVVKTNFGAFVIQHILEYARTDQQQSLLNLLSEHTSDICSSNISCSVVEAILKNRSHEDCRAFATSIVKHGAITTLARSRNGHNALKRLLNVLGGTFECEVAHKQLLAAKGRLSKSRHGRGILKVIEDRCDSNASPVSASVESVHQKLSRRLSWADMSEDSY